MTTTKTDSIQRELDKGNPNTLPDCWRQVKPGHMLAPIKATFVGLTAAAAVDITTAASKAAAPIVGIALDTGENLPPILNVRTLRVTAVGTGALGPRVPTDADGTAGAPGANGPGIALLSDDGKTLTFEGTVTGFILEYSPLPYTDLQTEFSNQG